MRPCEYSTEQRNQVVQFILGRCINGKPAHRTFMEVAAKLSISRYTCSRYWDAAKKQKESGKAIQLVSGKKLENIHTIHLDLTLLQSLDISKRSTIRTLAVGLKYSKSTVGRWVKSGMIRSHTSAIRPNLTAPNKMLRLRFSLEALEVDRFIQKIKFRNMYNTIHIDEKWFYITKGALSFIWHRGRMTHIGVVKIRNSFKKLCLCVLCLDRYL